ncbi:hypothetical protein NLA06_12615 [Desulfomicrobium sp. ZS1]|uniref:hypothetical protein n=1 Tax=Desulfomicrobium sp. ZS1 TaxID=2952228 RepID=UPI0020B314E7|nr:hypothetical protein [Desulfomicrobium sp. ZS1]UTF49399.1 hypothetical protein NLA06_12615 [Desulfomicrobium sp. ZS1]
MKKLLTGTILLFILSTGCTWQDTAKFTANAAVYSAMIATGNAGDWNMNADLAGQAAEDFADLAFNCTE